VKWRGVGAVIYNVMLYTCYITIYNVKGFPKYNRAKLGPIRPLAPSTPPIFFTSNLFMHKDGKHSRRESILDGIGREWYTYVQGHMKPEELFRKLISGKPKQWEAVFKQ